MSPPPSHSSRARGSPAAPSRPPTGSAHRRATPADRIARPSADSGSLGAPAGTGGRVPSPQPGGHGPYRARVPSEMGEKAPKTASCAKYQISSSQRSSGDALLAFALRAPVPPAFGPGPSPRVFPPIPGGESCAIGRLNDVSPGSPNVLRAIPRPMTGVPGIAGGRRRRHFYQGRRRLCRHNRCGRWGRS
jgi:hypothetical protein